MELSLHLRLHSPTVFIMSKLYIGHNILRCLPALFGYVARSRSTSVYDRMPTTSRYQLSKLAPL